MAWKWINGAAPTSCSDENGHSLNSLINCLDRWVHFNPHLGVLVIDSPLKSYADPKSKEQRDVEASTVTDRFYAWLSKWTGPGQLVILENQEIKGNSKSVLNPLEFVGDSDDEGRRGFYPGASGDT